MTVVPELTPAQFRERWPAAPDSEDVVVLDVREPQELAVASVSGALHIPMREIPGRFDELELEKPIIVMCHTGGRSRQVAGFLLASGYGNVFNLAGGIDAWSVEIDPQVPRY
ncbi:MAG TPA: rhodanese-like domain-containing protein [Gammaproteobacteria bacterium]